MSTASSEILDAFEDMRDFHGVAVAYARGATVAASPITLIQQMRSYDVDNGQGVFETMTVVDWLGLFSDLSDEGFGVPQYGDVITLNGRKYEVLGQGAQLPPFEVEDPYEQIVKIHTLEVAP